MTLSDTLGQREVTALFLRFERRNSRNTLFCKGLNFKEIYLENAVKDGLEIYVSEVPYEVPAQLGIIVTDIKKQWLC